MLSRYKIQTEGLRCEGHVYGRTRCWSETAPAIQIMNNTTTKENIPIKRIMWRIDRLDKWVSEPRNHDAVNINTNRGVLSKQNKPNKIKYKRLGLFFIFTCLWWTKEAWKKKECFFLFLSQCTSSPSRNSPSCQCHRFYQVSGVLVRPACQLLSNTYPNSSF